MGPLPARFIVELLDALRANERALSKEAFSQEKRRLAAKHGLLGVPSDIQVLLQLEEPDLTFAKPFLLSKPVRAESGVSVVAIMTRPSRCPHGRCTYCPGGLGSAFGDVPQSYTGHEPATMRGLRAGFDAYLQVFGRLEQYVAGGHDPQKVELILMGGTFLHEERGYKDAFVRDAFQALTDFGRLFFPDGTLDLDRFKRFFLLPGRFDDAERSAEVRSRIEAVHSERARSLAEAQKENETAAIRCVGLTVETRPSHGRTEHGLELLRLGCTRVELGLQTLDDAALAAVHRDQTVEEAAASMAELRDLGFKLNCHVMLGLPLMTPSKDLAVARRLFADSAFRPDMVKLYPCMVLPGTPLFSEHRAGRFTPLTTAEAATLIADIMGFVPRWCRVMRIQRDIPTHVTAAGVDRTNLRQLVEREMTLKGIRSQDMRAREIRARSYAKAVLNVIGYEASGGEEFFISIDDPEQDALLGFCRLRFPARLLAPEFDLRTAIVRELHVYGRATGLGVVGIEKSAQHRGFGSQLLAVAERIAREHGKRKLLVIAGIGVREYYRKRGYEREGQYMRKLL